MTIAWLDHFIDSLEGKSKRNEPLFDQENLHLDAARRDRVEKLNFFAEGNHKLGRIIMASGAGRRTTDNTRLGWAVLEGYPSKIGSNEINNRLPGPIHGMKSPKTNLIQEDGNSLRHGAWNIGSETGVTRLESSQIKSDVRLAWDQWTNDTYSRECCYTVTTESKVARKADCGSLVVTDDMQWTGLLWGGSKAYKDNGPAVF